MPKNEKSGRPDSDTQRHTENLKKSVINTRNAIRKKFRELHNEKLAVSHLISETYKPIIEPLNTLVKREKQKLESNNNNNNNKTIKREKNEGFFRSFPDSVFKTAMQPKRRNIFDYSPEASGSQSNLHDISGVKPFGVDAIEEEEEEEKEKDQDRDKDKDEIENLENHIKTQVRKTNSPLIDHTYGFKYKHGQLLLGKDVVLTKETPTGLVYAIRKKEFPVTKGVTELLLSSNPTQYKKEDLQTYKDMLSYTSAHKKNFQRSGAIVRSASTPKYGNIISKLFPKRGAGVMHKPQLKYKVVNKTNGAENANYTYWDDPNELVDRLRLLMASQAAGHTSHDNEIVSIVEELREANIIE